MTTEKKRILQIMPAGSWCAEYSDPPSVSRLVSWALVEYTYTDNDKVFTGVEGMDAADSVEFCQEANNFARYVEMTDAQIVAFNERFDEDSK